MAKTGRERGGELQLGLRQRRVRWPVNNGAGLDKQGREGPTAVSFAAPLMPARIAAHCRNFKQLIESARVEVFCQSIA